jgi:Arc/MetJ-type ribon-helix-helix transcriptional regulator
MTIHVPQDLARLIEDAISTGQYDSEVDVIRDALIRLRPAMEVTAATSDPIGKSVLQEKPLTKQTLLRHLADIGLVDHSPDISSDRNPAAAPLSDDEDDVISEVVIRERLIEWLTGFL